MSNSRQWNTTSQRFHDRDTGQFVPTFLPSERYSPMTTPVKDEPTQAAGTVTPPAADDQPTPAQGAGTTTTPPNAAPGTPPAPGAPGSGQGGDDEFDKDRAMKLIEKLRGEEKRAKEQDKELARLAAKLQEFEDAKLSEKDRLEKRATQLDTDLKAAKAELEVQTARAGKLSEMMSGWLTAEIKAWPAEVKALDPGEDDLLARLAWVEKARPLAQKLLTPTAPPPPKEPETPPPPTEPAPKGNPPSPKPTSGVKGEIAPMVTADRM